MYIAEALKSNCLLVVQFLKEVNLTSGNFRESDEISLKVGWFCSVIQTLLTLFIRQSSCFIAVTGVKSAFSIFSKNPLHLGKNSFTTSLRSSASPKSHLLKLDAIPYDGFGYTNASYWCHVPVQKLFKVFK